MTIHCTGLQPKLYSVQEGGEEGAEDSDDCDEDEGNFPHERNLQYIPDRFHGYAVQGKLELPTAMKLVGSILRSWMRLLRSV